MRRNTKAPLAGSSLGWEGGPRSSRRAALVACLLSLVGALCFAPAAFGGTAVDRPLLFSFDGSDTTAGTFGALARLDIDQTNGFVYVIDQGNNVLDKFNLAGEAQNFTATGNSSLAPGFNFGSIGDVAVDNSPVNAGRIHVLKSAGPVKAFGPEGSELWSIPQGELGSICGIAVDTEGHPWVTEQSTGPIQLASSGNPPARIGSEPIINSCSVDLGAGGSVFASHINKGTVDKYEEGEKVATIDPGSTVNVTVDQSSPNGHIFTLHQYSFNEYTANGDLVGTFGQGDLESNGTFSNAVGIAYSKSLNRVYVTENPSNTVKVFGFVSGTVPDATMDQVTTIGASTAELTGTVNPQSVDNDWHFEWKKTSQSWSEAESSPVESLPVDSDDHDVSYEATGLSADTAYNARIVVHNTALSLKAESNVQNFSNIPVRIETVPAAPRMDTTARINASVNPGGNIATYHFEYSKDGASWTVLPDRETAAVTNSIAVGEDLSGLQPSTTYHFRVFAESVLGSADPQGTELTFTTRSSAEVAEPRSCSNEDIRMAQRATYLGECRALELVNNPDKGNQNVLTSQPSIGTTPVSPDGEKAVWAVLGGTQGGTTGTGATFLAERGSDGWHSKGIVPAAEDQIGKGGFKYTLEAATPDFSKFVFLATRSLLTSGTDPAVVRLDDNRNQEILTSDPGGFFTPSSIGSGIDLSNDAAHIFQIDDTTEQLEDVGGSAPEVVSIMPDDTPSECGLSQSKGSFLGVSGTGTGATLSWRPENHPFAVTDGSRVYFEVPPNGSCSDPLGLYQRNRESDTTTLIDPGVGGSEVHMIRATPDGRSVYFTTRSILDPADLSSGNDVYRWDEETNEAHCLTCVVSDASVSGPVLISNDYSHIYFQSEEQLVSGKGTAGHPNVYVLSGGVVSFVADTTSPDLFGVGIFGEESVNAESSEDGKVLFFRSRPNPNLTADEVPDECINAKGFPRSCQQLYRYDDRNGGLECVSCRSDDSTTGSVATADTSLKSADFQVSGDGSTVAFATSAALLRSDINRSLDLYEWRNGILHLLSNGVDTFPVSLYGTPAVRSVSADGRDIFFSLVDPGRTGYERDGVANLYDARIGGGFPPPAPAAHCSEESCQGPLQAAPELDRAASAFLHGPGNQKQGFARRKARCAKKHGQAKKRCARKARCAGKRGKAKKRCIRKHKKRHLHKARVKQTRVKHHARGGK